MYQEAEIPHTAGRGGWRGGAGVNVHLPWQSSDEVLSRSHQPQGPAGIGAIPKHDIHYNLVNILLHGSVSLVNSWLLFSL
jgi:hypothetical protein